MLPRFEIVRTAGGEISIRNNVVNEVMHNPVGPWAEANALYIKASKLHQALAKDSPTLVVYDVGLGAAANALATLTAAHEVKRELGRCRPLTIISFEIDLTLLAFVVEEAARIPYAAGFKDVLKTLLAEGQWKSPGQEITWILHEGDFLETVHLESELPDIVFYDPYSPKANGEMWAPEAFAALHKKAANGSHDFAVFTYSRATPVRTAMLVAGFHVGRGPRSGLKDETTQAATSKHLLQQPLDERWLIRWLRSHSRFPLTNSYSDHAMTNAVLTHPQFSDNIQNSLLGWRRLQPVRTGR